MARPTVNDKMAKERKSMIDRLEKKLMRFTSKNYQKIPDIIKTADGDFKKIMELLNASFNAVEHGDVGRAKSVLEELALMSKSFSGQLQTMKAGRPDVSETGEYKKKNLSMKMDLAREAVKLAQDFSTFVSRSR